MQNKPLVKTSFVLPFHKDILNVGGNKTIVAGTKVIIFFGHKDIPEDLLDLERSFSSPLIPSNLIYNTNLKFRFQKIPIKVENNILSHITKQIKKHKLL